MLVKDILNSKKTALSFEFFPPKTEKAASLLKERIDGLIPLRPAYVSVTYGAGGAGRDHTKALIEKLISEEQLEVVSHLTCVGHSEDEIAQILDHYEEIGVHNILALRGDMPQNLPDGFVRDRGFDHAISLVEFIKKRCPQMGIGVAGFPEGHPETPNRLKEIEYLKAKVDAGADYICTQLFFDNRDFFDFCERCEVAGIKIPIVAGVMPITSLTGMKRMCELALGARIPAKLMKSVVRAYQTNHEDSRNNYIEKVGIAWATQQVRELIDSHVAGVHFYTLNQSNATVEIFQNLGIKDSDALDVESKNHLLF